MKRLNDDEFLEQEFDFSKAVKNPYAKKLHKKITMNVDADALSTLKVSQQIPVYLIRRL